MSVRDMCREAAASCPGSRYHSSLSCCISQQTRYRYDFVSLDSAAGRCHNGGPQKYCRKWDLDLQLSWKLQGAYEACSRSLMTF